MRYNLSMTKKQLFWWFIWLTTAVVGTLTAVSLLAVWWWGFAALGHFQLQYASLLILTAVVALLGRRWWLLLASLLPLGLVVLTAWPLLTALNTEGKAPGTAEQPLMVITLNLFDSNPTPDAVLDYLTAVDADIVVLQEATPAWQERLADVAGAYPTVVQDEAETVMLLSHLPLVETYFAEEGRHGRAPLVASLLAGDELITVIGVHPVPPVTAVRAEEQAADLALIAELAAQETTPLIVAGDFNLSPFSPQFQDFLTVSGLQDSREGQGMTAIWPDPLPAFYLPLDHVLISDDWLALDYEVGPFLGSNHRPLLVSLLLAKGQ